MTTKEFNPFLFYSKQLQELLEKAAKQENPALWLFKHDARTVLFMLEALTRIHSKAFDEKLFDKWNKRFKKLEDLFGQIDDYALLEKEFSRNKKITKETIKYFSVNTNKYIERCNLRLREKDWLVEKMQRFDEQLDEFDVEYNKDYIDELKFALVDEIDAILYTAVKSDYHFTKLEEQIHEMRRKLRWLSIYAQAFRGLIQLKKSTEKQKFELNYFTKEVLSSPFNKVLAKPKKVPAIVYDKDCFLAISWLIEALGKLKDKGLKALELRDAIFIAEDMTKEQAMEKAKSILEFKKTMENDILVEASALIKTALVKDKILYKLLIA